MAAHPLARLELTCATAAEHLGFVALADVAAAMANGDSRIIGGQMTTLHVLRWGLGLTRLTQDVDLGVKPLAVQTPELTSGLERLGYSQSAGNRFEKLVTTEVPGLALAFRRQPVDILLDVTFLDGSKRSFPARLPDEVAALTLKVMARTVCRKYNDAIDT